MKRTCQQRLSRIKKKTKDLRKYDVILITGIGAKKRETKNIIWLSVYISFTLEKGLVLTENSKRVVVLFSIQWARGKNIKNEQLMSKCGQF